MSRQNYRHDPFLKHQVKKTCLFLSLCLLLTIAFISQQNLTNNSLIVKPSDIVNLPNYNKYAIDTPGCKIPLLDPFDPSLRSFIRNVSKFDYKCKLPQLFYMVGDWLIPNVEELVKLGNQYVSCGYLPFHRVSDDLVEYEYPVRLIRYPINIRDEFIIVMCNTSKEVFYRDVFATIVKKPTVESRCKKALAKKVPKNGRRLNVLLIGIDSTSKNHYHRHLLRTDKFIRKHLKFIELHGYNKVGRNTIPNMVPFLTGKLESEYPFIFVRGVMDNLSLVWKKFAKVGYRTLLAEDTSYAATFHGSVNGFLAPQTDYYLRPYNIAFNNKMYSQKNLLSGCSRNRTQASVVLQWVQEFYGKFKGDPLFAYTFLSEFSSSNNYNAVAMYDQSLLKFFETFYRKGHFNNTIVLFFSDHGFRYSYIRTTYAGYLEDKLPFCFMILPPWFSKVYPKYYKNAKLNQRRLVTPFDMHATMLDILNYLSLVKNTSSSGNRSVSLFTPISKKRTCEIANIHTMYCSCSDRQPVANDSDTAVECGRQLVQFINDLTDNYRNVCSIVSLTEIISVSSQTILTDVGKRNESYAINYQITVKVVPNLAVFQGIVWFWGLSERFQVESEIDRINLYGNQSYCIDDSRLKLFCFCHGVEPPSGESSEDYFN